MQPIHLKDLLEAGCHFGHKADRWHPKAHTFIYQERNGIHVIDLAKTKAGLEKAADFIKDMAKDGNKVLFVGTKRQAAAIVKEAADKAGAPYITKRWIGGFLTNWEQVHKNLEKIRRLSEEEKTNAWKIFPKHERVKLGRYLNRLLQFYGGVVELREPPKALVVFDIRREDVAVREAKRIGIPVVGIVDTNSDPTGIDYVVPSNDDAVGAVKLLADYLTGAYQEGVAEGVKVAEVKAAQEAKEAAKQTKAAEAPKQPQAATETKEVVKEVAKKPQKKAPKKEVK